MKVGGCYLNSRTNSIGTAVKSKSNQAEECTVSFNTNVISNVTSAVVGSHHPHYFAEGYRIVILASVVTLYF